jgi:hypothetical protein
MQEILGIKEIQAKGRTQDREKQTRFTTIARLWYDD